MNKNNPLIINIMGPTASGKTDLAIRLLHQLPAEIISVDSAMIYRGMDIGTAKPNKEDLEKAHHRLIDICDVDENYSVGQFCDDALSEIKDIVANGNTPILVGGTMMYFNRLLFGMADLPQADQSVRDKILKEAEQVGWEAMHEKLAAIDPRSSKKIKPQDPQRISRALEVYELTGKTISSFHSKEQASYLSAYNVINIALIPEDRSWLHKRIEKRFDKMIEDGFLIEAKKFFDNPNLTSDLPSMRMVGYRQAWDYFAGICTLDEMRERAIAATRQLAKRQLTWLRQWEGLHHFNSNDKEVFEKVWQLLSVAKHSN